MNNLLPHFNKNLKIHKKCSNKIICVHSSNKSVREERKNQMNFYMKNTPSRNWDEKRVQLRDSPLKRLCQMSQPVNQIKTLPSNFTSKFFSFLWIKFHFIRIAFALAERDAQTFSNEKFSVRFFYALKAFSFWDEKKNH